MPDNQGYLDTAEANLFRPMKESATQGLSQGSGSELSGTKNGRAKIHAAHSSSALALNVFDYFTDHDRAVLSKALGITTGISSLAFEGQYPTGLGGTPPHLDVVLKLDDGSTIAIESKFTEWMDATAGRSEFSESYFPEGKSLWTLRALPQSQRLANLIQSGEERFVHLDANQLLKHALGLANQLGQNFELHYLYFDAPGIESEKHSAEVDRFKSYVGDELRFKAISYQQLFQSLSTDSKLDKQYLDYLSRRYFPVQTS